jgi:hypothetical protein
MKRHRKSMGSSANPITEMAATVATVMAKRTRMIHELLPKLALAVAANEEAQRKFRTAVMIKLSRIETMVSMIQGGQIVESQGWRPVYAEKAKKEAQVAEEFISQKSNELGLAMVNYIYGESEVPGTRSKARRK